MLDKTEDSILQSHYNVSSLNSHIWLIDMLFKNILIILFVAECSLRQWWSRSLSDVSLIRTINEKK